MCMSNNMFNDIFSQKLLLNLAKLKILQCKCCTNGILTEGHPFICHISVLMKYFLGKAT